MKMNKNREERKNVPSHIRKAVLERDQYRCRKCGMKNTLELHHIIPVAQGGENSVDNLISLCTPCHHEWEHIIYVNMPDIPFETWLDLPLYPQLIAVFARADERYDNVKVSMYEMQAILMGAHQIWRSSHMWEDAWTGDVEDEENMEGVSQGSLHDLVRDAKRLHVESLIQAGVTELDAIEKGDQFAEELLHAYKRIDVSIYQPVLFN